MMTPEQSCAVAIALTRSQGGGETVMHPAEARNDRSAMVISAFPAVIVFGALILLLALALFMAPRETTGSA